MRTKNLDLHHFLNYVRKFCLLLLLCVTASMIKAQCDINMNADINFSVDITPDANGDCSIDMTVAHFSNGVNAACTDFDSYAIIVKHGTQVLFDSRTDAVPAVVLMDPVTDIATWPNASDHIKKNLIVELLVLDAAGGLLNMTWGNMLVEDKDAPIITPNADLIVNCFELMDFELPNVSDCSGIESIRVVSETTFSECAEIELQGAGFSAIYSKVIVRQYVAEDKCENVSDPVTQRLLVRRMDPSLIVCPADVIINCDDVTDACDALDGDGIPDPTPTCGGVPFIDVDGSGTFTDGDIYLPVLNLEGAVIDEEFFNHCKIGARLTVDYTINTDCTKTTNRIWNVSQWDDCNGETNLSLCDQEIKVVDDEGPTVENGPHDFEATTNGYNCEAYVQIPPITFVDNCGDISKVTVNIVDEDGVPVHSISEFDFENGEFAPLPQGINKVTYTGYDQCHQSGEDELFITVEDNTAPVAICDSHTQISLNENTTVPASVFDDGSVDDCPGDLTFLARRMDGENCDNLPVYDNMHYLGLFAGRHIYFSKKEATGQKATALALSKGAIIASRRNDIRAALFGLGEISANTNGALQTEFFVSQNIETAGEKRFLIQFTANTIDEAFSSKVHFCCPESPGEKMVVFRVVDKWGNYNECMVSVDLKENSEVNLECPPDVTVTCGIPVDLSDDASIADIFGEVVSDPSTRGSLMIPSEFLVIPYCLSGTTNADGNYVTPSFLWDCDEPENYTTLAEAEQLFSDLGDNADTNPVGFDPEAFAATLWDGLALNQCGTAQVTVDNDDSGINQCGRGNLVRTFTSGDKTCSQTITFQRGGDMASSMIMPEAIVLTTGCMNTDMDSGIAFPPEDPQFGKPTIVEDDCDLVGINFEDEVFTFNNSAGDACFKVLREWTVIDWCKVDGNNDPDADIYVGTHLQTIKVNNSVDPTIDFDDQDFTSFSSDCDRDAFNISATLEDDCTNPENLVWSAFLIPNGDILLETRIAGGVGEVNGVAEAVGDELQVSFDYVIPFGEHQIRWEVKDQCGNSAATTNNVTVQNAKAPTPYCISLLTVDLTLMQNDPITGDVLDEPEGMVLIWASDFATGNNFHPCYDDDRIVYSFTSDPTDTHRLYTCCCANGSEEVNIYSSILDSDGNIISQSWCTANLIIQDNGELQSDGSVVNACTNFDDTDCDVVCGVPANPTSARISGFVSTENNEMIEDVEVRLVGSELDPTTTDENGAYTFSSMATGGDYIIDPKNDIDPMNGVSTLDLVIIQKHILGLQDLDSPFKVIAADINMDSRVSTSDLVELRKLILGIDGDFDENESWRFVSNEYTFSNPTNPLVEFFLEQYEIEGLSQDMTIDFTAVKIGDVNETATINNILNTEVRSKDQLTLVIDELDFESGETVSIPVYSLSEMQLLGMQFTSSFDNDLVEFLGVESGSLSLDKTNIGLQRVNQGQMTFSWHSATSLITDASKPLFTLSFIAKKDGNVASVLDVNSKLTKAEAYANTQEVMDLSLSFRNGQELVKNYNLYQNTPNPFKNSTVIGFDLPKSEFVTIRVHDVTGKTITQVNGNYAKGYNQITLDKSRINATGVLYYTLATETYTSTKKMVILQ